MNPHSSKPAAPDDLDRLLSGYFKNQMPHAWPAAPAVQAEPAPRSFARNRSTSRWALAASVMLLVGVCWYAGRGTEPVIKPIAEQKIDKSLKAGGENPILHEMQKHGALSPPEPLQP